MTQGRFALFMGEHHEASGGWDDLRHIGSIEECKAKCGSASYKDWAHIVDLDRGVEVMYIVHHCEQAVLTGWPDKWTFEWVAI